MSVAPGWYPDNMGVIRYWDGAQWTAHTQAPQQPQAYEAPQQQQQQFEQTPASADGHVAPHYAPPQPVQFAQPQYTQPQYIEPQYAQPYQQHIVGTGEANGVATAGFIVGLVSVFLPLFFGLGVGAAGLVLSIVGASRSATTGTGKGLAIAGIVLSAVGILFIL